MHPLLKLIEIEEERNIVLPKAYKDFYDACSYSISDNLVGTDVGVKSWLSLPELHFAAIELLEDDGIENFLQKNNFVFMMHQGYQFWYFKADGNPDPSVFYYHEGRLKPENKGPFAEFIKDFY